MEPGSGYLACGWLGKGRLAETGEIVDAAMAALARRRDLEGQTVLVTAGPTVEDLDPVRFVSNRSSGKMGYRIAEAARDRGASVVLVSGPTGLTPARRGRDRGGPLGRGDAARGGGAGGPRDGRDRGGGGERLPARRRRARRSSRRRTARVTLELVRTPDILKGLGEAKGGRVLVGFAAETGDLVANAAQKLEGKNLDLIVANDVTAPGAGFGGDTNAVVAPAARREPGRRPARLEARGGRAHPRRGARAAPGGPRVSPGKPRPATGTSEREDALADLLAHGRALASVAAVGVPWPPPGRGRRRRRAAGARGGPSDPAAGLAAIREDLGDCQRCRLAGGRKTIVFGQGNPRAELMFVGEGPGADEDEQGLAFVGRAGQLLTDIIEKGMKMQRSEVFIANVIKCRPPQNRNPEPDEILACQPFLEAQIRAIRPRVLVGLGKFGGAVAPRRRPSPSPGSAAASGSTRASRSCPPTTRPTCCGTRRGRRTSGRT